MCASDHAQPRTRHQIFNQPSQVKSKCWSHSLPRISGTLSAPHQNFSLPVHSSDQVMTSQVSSSPLSKLFDKHFGPVHFPGIFMCLLPLPHLIHRYLSASAQHSVRCFVSSLFLSTKIHFSLGFAKSSSHSPSIVLPSSGSWLQSCRSCFRHKPFIQQCSYFANSSAFSLPLVTNLSKCGTSFPSL